NKALFFETLSKFKMPHPEVSMIEPSTREGWLAKPPRGEGGIGIYRFGTKAPVACSDVYWQRWVEGIPGSALFLADGRSVKVIGYNVQWTRNLGPEYEFCFVGMMNESPLTKAQSVEIRKQIEVLVRAFGLVGLNSLDFIVDGGNVWILEINARPSAGMQLYGHDSLSRHIDACLGRPLTAVTEKIGYCGYRIVFAETDIEIPNGFPWPEDCRDLPRAGLIIRKGRPVCSIISRDSNPKRLFRNLLATERIIINHLEEKGL
ncbi:MAG: ATP-grasp domain-containing protein, partial [Gammaproteobacteria bacterium]